MPAHAPENIIVVGGGIGGLADTVAAAGGDFAASFLTYQQARITRTARVQWSSRMLGEIYHAKDVYRLVRNRAFGARPPEQFYDSLAWIYGGLGESTAP